MRKYRKDTDFVVALQEEIFELFNFLGVIDTVCTV